MREEEKIFSGKMFDPRKKELKDIKHKVHTACQRYNAMDEYDPNRLPVIKEFIGDIGKTYYFRDRSSSITAVILVLEKTFLRISILW